MSEKLFKTVKEALLECNSLPEEAKEILKTTVSIYLKFYLGRYV